MQSDVRAVDDAWKVEDKKMADFSTKSDLNKAGNPARDLASQPQGVQGPWTSGILF
jgi:hypothetical protein